MEDTVRRRLWRSSIRACSFASGNARLNRTVCSQTRAGDRISLPSAENHCEQHEENGATDHKKLKLRTAGNGRRLAANQRPLHRLHQPSHPRPHIGIIEVRHFLEHPHRHHVHRLAAVIRQPLQSPALITAADGQWICASAVPAEESAPPLARVPPHHGQRPNCINIGR